MFSKNDISLKFIQEWVFWCIYYDNQLKRPLVTYHHTADQSIFNILVYKYDLKVFYSPEIDHDINKDRNKVLNIVNNSTNTEEYFISPKNISI
jgi:hypothetical protein